MPRSMPRRTPLRLWMTGCVAVVMAAMGSNLARAKPEQTMDRHGRHALVSPYDVEETVSKIEAAAASHGLVVFVKRAAHGGQTQATLVLGLSGGVTPVMMGGHGSEIELPLQIDVVRAADGRTEVRFHEPWAWSEDVEAAPDALKAIGPLPDLLQTALAT